MEPSPFGSPRRWPRSDLIAISHEFGPDLVIAAYRNGVFPMPTDDHMGWFSPMARATLPLGRLRVTRSLAKMAKRYDVRVDTAFEEVLDACGDPQRPGSWIDDDIRRVYRQLHYQGIVHSVESWTADGRLAGGLYGVSIGGLFAGESMFHRPDIGRDASKVALVALVDILRADGVDRLLDVQWQTPHLASLGVTEVPRLDYIRQLRHALTLPAPSWSPS